MPIQYKYNKKIQCQYNTKYNDNTIPIKKYKIQCPIQNNTMSLQ